MLALIRDSLIEQTFSFIGPQVMEIFFNIEQENWLT